MASVPGQPGSKTEQRGIYAHLSSREILPVFRCWTFKVKTTAFDGKSSRLITFAVIATHLPVASVRLFVSCIVILTMFDLAASSWVLLSVCCGNHICHMKQKFTH